MRTKWVDMLDLYTPEYVGNIASYSALNYYWSKLVGHARVSLEISKEARSIYSIARTLNKVSRKVRRFLYLENRVPAVVRLEWREIDETVDLPILRSIVLPWSTTNVCSQVNGERNISLSTTTYVELREIGICIRRRPRFFAFLERIVFLVTVAIPSSSNVFLSKSRDANGRL